MNNFLKRYNLLVVNGLLFLSLLSKETGILFVAISIVWVYLFKKISFKIFLVSLLPLATCYLFIRCIIAGVWFDGSSHTVFGNLSLAERLINLPAIIFHYLHIVVFPKDLLLGQTWVTTKDLSGVYLPTITISCGVISLISLLRKQKKNKSFFLPLLFFVSWLGLGLLLHIQIFPLEMTVADRWFYFPLIGVVGIIGVLVENNKNKKLLKVLMVVVMIVVVAFFIRSYIRIGDFKDSLTLYSHDTKHTRSYLLEHSLGYELMQIKKYKEALPHLLNSITLFENTNNTNTLGVYYYQTYSTTSAITMFEKSISLGNNYLAYRNASQIYLDGKDFMKAENILEKATKAFPSDSNFWFLLSIADYKLGKNNSALDAAETAYQLNPSSQNFYIVNQLRIGEPIKFNEQK
jgi:Tfp pilus assembly protein PilF